MSDLAPLIDRLRRDDPDRLAMALLAPAAARSRLVTLYALNAELAKLPGWKPLTKRKASLPDADDWNGKEGKLDLLER